MYTTRYLIRHRLNSDLTVIVNTLSGALDVIENKYLELLDHPDSAPRDSAIVKSMLGRGYLFSSKEAEDAQLNQLFERFSQTKRPTVFVLCPTYACNLRCVYCFEGSLTQTRPRIITTAEVDAAYDVINKLADGPASIQLFGGEPFLPAAKKIVEYTVERAVAFGHKVGAVTNGVYLTQFLPLLTKYRDHLEDFQVTVDGPAAIHDLRRPKAGGRGSFADIVKSIDGALASGIYIRMRVNVDADNIGYLIELANFIQEKGWDKYKNFGALLSPVDDHKGADLPNRLTEDQTATLWLEMLNKHPQLKLFRADLWRTLDFILTTLGTDKLSFPRFNYCESNYLGCYTFGTDGRIYLCAEAIGDRRTAVGSYYPEFSLDKAKLDQWNGRSIMTIDKCHDCSVATLCGGGCAYAALCINGSIAEPRCNGAEETLHAYLDSIKEDLLTR